MVIGLQWQSGSWRSELDFNLDEKVWFLRCNKAIIEGETEEGLLDEELFIFAGACVCKLSREEFKIVPTD